MIDIETLKKEREELKQRLKAIEVESKEVEKKMREVRQREVQTKREIEAITVLVDLQEARAAREQSKAAEVAKKEDKADGSTPPEPSPVEADNGVDKGDN